jgi:hypothetical protein
MVTLEFDCYECEGKGSYKINKNSFMEECHLCKGTGKLDWVDNITPQSFPLFDFKNSQIVRIVNHINKEIGKLLENESDDFEIIKYKAKRDILEPIVNNKLLAEYRVYIIENYMYVDMKSYRRTELIQLQFGDFRI